MTVGELAVLGSMALVGLTAWMSLALAHAEVHDARVAFGGPTLALGVGALGWWRRSGPPVVDPVECGVLAFFFLGGLLLFFPGFHYAVADKDPGVYVAHAFSIERTGSYVYHDPTLANGLPINETYRTSRFPGIWVNDEATGRIVPQFFHLLPAVFATGLGLLGPRAIFSFNGVMALLSVLGLILAVRRAFGWTAAIGAGAVLLTNMVEVWHARYPTTEILTQMFIVGALLGIVVSVQTGTRIPAALAGMLVGLTFLTRPDGILPVLLSVAVLTTLIALHRFDSRCRWFAVGLGLVLPHAAYQAYGVANRYASLNGLPRFGTILSVVFALVGSALLLGRIGRRYDKRWQAEVLEWIEPRAGKVLTVAFVSAVVFGLLRPVLFGEDWGTFFGRAYRTYDEDTVRRLAWFVTGPGLAAMCLGFGIVANRPWRLTRWVLVLPGAFVPLYLWHARVASRLMWSTRRLVPFTLVMCAVLIAAGAAWAMERRRSPILRCGAAVMLAFILMTQARMSLSLRSHDEFGGSYELGREIAAMATHRKAVFLWSDPTGVWDPALLFGAPLALMYGEVSAILPPDPTPADIDAYARAFPGTPVFVAGPTGGLFPQTLDASRLRPVRQIVRELPVWEETDDRRPSRSVRMQVNFGIWRLNGT